MLKNVNQSGKGVKSSEKVCSGICLGGVAQAGKPRRVCSSICTGRFAWWASQHCPSACLGELVQQASPSICLGTCPSKLVQADRQTCLLTFETLNNSELLEAI